MNALISTHDNHPFLTIMALPDLPEANPSIVPLFQLGAKRTKFNIIGRPAIAARLVSIFINPFNTGRC